MPVPPAPRLATLVVLGLCSCAGPGRGTIGPGAGMECAPFARALTGVALYGPADSWWPAAAGRYRRSSAPEPGSVLVFARSDRLPSGHVSVVASVLSPREILLTQANWLHGRIGLDQPALDMSPGNDWTLVRVYWPPSGQIGTTIYPTYGFIVPDRPLNHASITAGVPRAMRLAAAGFE